MWLSCWNFHVIEGRYNRRSLHRRFKRIRLYCNVPCFILKVQAVKSTVRYELANVSGFSVLRIILFKQQNLMSIPFTCSASDSRKSRLYHNPIFLSPLHEFPVTCKRDIWATKSSLLTISSDKLKINHMILLLRAINKKKTKKKKTLIFVMDPDRLVYLIS
jgi:hypothetical protein